MQITTISLPDVSGLAEQIAPALVEAGQAQIAQMQIRASRGIGVDDARMPAYSSEYAKRKKGLGRQVSVRDLTMSGSMLRSLHVENVRVEGRKAEVTIAFSDANDAHKAAYNQSIAPWFGASPKDTALVTDLLLQRIGALLGEQERS